MEKSSVQRFVKNFLPKSWSDDIEAESRTWMLKCPNCAYEQSYWDIGGIRWKAAGNPRIRRLCPNCNQVGWHTVYRKTA